MDAIDSIFQEIISNLIVVVTSAVISLVISSVTAYVSYKYGRRAKIDEIQIAKHHEFAEKLSVLLQEDFTDRANLRQEYQTNFGHLKNLSEAMRYFYEHNDVYSHLNQGITHIPHRISEIIETNQRAVIYLPESVTSLIFEYAELTKFIYTTDGIGLSDDYAEKFFEHLFDAKIRLEMENRYNLVMSELRKVVK